VLLLLGDECFGWKHTVDDLAGALSQLQIYPFADERLRHSMDPVEALERSVPLSNPSWGTFINGWKQEVYRHVRVPGLLAPQHQALSALACVDSPLLSARIATRIALSKSTITNNKALARTLLETVAPPAVKSIPLSTKPIFTKSRFRTLWDAHREHFHDVLNTKTARHDFVDMRLCLIDMEQGMPVHILRERNRRSGATVLQRYIERTIPAKARAPWERSLAIFMLLNGNRPTEFTLSTLYAMQRFIMMADED